MLNNVSVVGRFVRDPEVKKTNTGVSVCSFTLACQRDYVAAGQERVTDWIPCVAWRQSADFIGKYFHKGDLIAVTGSLQTRKYEAQDGTTRNVLELMVSGASFVTSKRENATETPTETYTEDTSDDDLPF